MSLNFVFWTTVLYFILPVTSTIYLALGAGLVCDAGDETGLGAVVLNTTATASCPFAVIIAEASCIPMLDSVDEAGHSPFPKSRISLFQTYRIQYDIVQYKQAIQSRSIRHPTL